MANWFLPEFRGEGWAWRLATRAMIVLVLAALASLPVCAATNLVVNGTFAKADPRQPDAPLGWERPDGLGVAWTNAPDGRGRVIRMDTRLSEQTMVASWTRAGLTNDWFIPHAAGNAIGETYGLSYYSVPFMIASGVTYRVSGEIMGHAGAKIWVRGYGLFRGKLTRRYEQVLNCKGDGRDWQTWSIAFNPTLHRPEITEMRVMLYAYYPSGVYWFRNLRVEPVEAP